MFFGRNIVTPPEKDSDEKCYHAPVDIDVTRRRIDEELNEAFEEGKTWGRGFFNLCFIALYSVIQINAVVLVMRKDIRPVFLGLNLLLITVILDILEIVQPPALMKWIPFWSNSIGKGLVLCFISTVSSEGVFMLGFFAFIFSFLSVFSFLLVGSFSTPPPMLRYSRLFGSSLEQELPLASSSQTKYNVI